jgi:protein-tyrosine phosphatase
MNENNPEEGNGTVEESGLEGYVDIHCHCLPALDDGPSTLSEALDLCRALSADGAACVAATPHQLGRYDGCNDADSVRNAVSVFNKELRSNDIPLTVLAGADVRVDERICRLLEDDKILTLADGGKYILLELPHNIFIDIEPLLADLSSMGVYAVISHTERHPVIAKKPDLMRKWLEYPAYLQITAGSLVGEFGIVAEKCAWRLLDAGLVSIVATDAHDLIARRPLMKAAFHRISGRFGAEIGRLVCFTNPLRVVKGLDVVPAGFKQILNCSRK